MLGLTFGCSNTNHAEPIITGSGLDWPQQALKARRAVGSPRPHAMVETRSTLLIDEGIGMQSGRWWPAPPWADTHMATTHQFDGNPRVRLTQLIRAPAENDVEWAW